MAKRRSAKRTMRKELLSPKVTSGLESMAGFLSTHGPSRLFRLKKKLKHLPEGKVVIAVADRDTLALRVVETSWPGGASRAGALSRRLAEIDVLASELESREAPPAATTLTRSEEKVLTAGGFDLSPVRAEAADPVARATAEYARLLKDSLSVVEAARRLGVNESRVRQRLTGTPRSLFGVKHGREWRLPGFQFSEGGLVPGIERAIEAVDPAIHPVALYRWLTTENADLPFDESEERLLTPLEWLAGGNPPSVVVELAAEL